MENRTKNILQRLRDNASIIPNEVWRDTLWLQEDQKLGFKRNGHFIWRNKKKRQECTWKTFFLKKFHCWDERQIREIVGDYLLFIKERRKKLQARDVMICKNAEIRRMLLTRFGYDKFLREMKGVVVHKDREHELIKINWNKNEEPIKLVRVKDSTTGRFYLLRVPQTAKTCHQAVAWTFGMEPDEYQPLKET